tara:strand:- start:381 stop:533 length:153 start_codon:yes stop_codon:yes gene_type:complete
MIVIINEKKIKMIIEVLANVNHVVKAKAFVQLEKKSNRKNKKFIDFLITI